MTNEELDFQLSILRPKKGDILICQLPGMKRMASPEKDLTAWRVRAALDRYGCADVLFFMMPPEHEMKLLPLEVLEQGLQQLVALKRKQKP